MITCIFIICCDLCVCVLHHFTNTFLWCWPPMAIVILHLMFFLTRRDTTGGRVTVFHWSICLQSDIEHGMTLCSHTELRNLCYLLSSNRWETWWKWPRSTWMASGRVSAKASEAISPSPTFDCWNKRIRMTRVEETRVRPPDAACIPSPTLRPSHSEKKTVSTSTRHTDFWDKPHRTALRTLPVPSRLGWSHIMSFKSSQGQTDMGSCCWLRLPAQLQAFKKKKKKWNVISLLIWVDGSILSLNYLSEFTRKWQLSTHL